MKVAPKELVIAVLSLSALLIISGCQTTYSPTTTRNVEITGEPILLLPPMMRNSDTADIGQLGRHMFTEVSAASRTPVIYCPQVRELKHATTWENVYPEGIMDIAEVQSMGDIAKCGSVIVPQVQVCPRYPPYRAVVNMMWVKTEDGSVISQQLVDVDMALKAVSSDYDSFLDQRGIGETDTGRHEAHLSISLFYQYLAQRSARIVR